MNIPWNWGTKLTIFIIIFILFIIVLVYKSMTNDIMLVEKDYYPKGLVYQDRIDEMKNAKPLLPYFQIQQNQDFVIFSMAEIHPDTGTITFFRPSDNNLDMTYQLMPDNASRMHLPLDDFTKGKYVAKIYWKEAGTAYYIEKAFYFK